MHRVSFAFPVLPAISHVAVFCAGLIIGHIFTRLLDKKPLHFDKIFQSLVFLSITALWVAATTKAILYPDVEFPPQSLNFLFAVVVGSTATKFKQTMIEVGQSVFSVIKNDKK